MAPRSPRTLTKRGTLKKGSSATKLLVRSSSLRSSCRQRYLAWADALRNLESTCRGEVIGLQGPAAGAEAAPPPTPWMPPSLSSFLRALRYIFKKRKRFGGKLILSMFDYETATMLARLPGAAARVFDAAGTGRKGLHWPNRREIAHMKALVEFASCPTRVPYEEARKAGAQYTTPASVNTLTDGVHLLALAEAAYNSPKVVSAACAKLGYEVVYVDNHANAGEPAHFVCYREYDRLAVLSIRGTASADDVLTDLAAKENCKQGFCAHEGMDAASKFIVKRVTPILRDLLAPQGYRLIVTGHSMGAGIGALAAYRLSKCVHAWKYPLAMRCVCFAPPAVLGELASQACKATATGFAGAPLVVGFVCRDDVVPRLSFHNFGILFRQVSGICKDLDMRDFDAQKTALAQKLAPGCDHWVARSLGGADEAMKEREERLSCQWSAPDKRDLMAPGEVVVLHPPAAGASAPAWSASSGDGTLPELRYIELSSRLVKDHFVTTYREAIQSAAGAAGVRIVGPRPGEAFESWALGAHK